MKRFTSREIDTIMCKTGYVQLNKEVYLFGEIRGRGISGTFGYYAILEGRSYGKQIKVGIYSMAELLHHVSDGVIVLGKDNS